MKAPLTALFLGTLLVGCGESSPSNTPTPAASATRVITLAGNLAFGDVIVGQSKTATLTISNAGTSALTVTGMTAPNGGAYSSTFTNGTIGPGASQNATIRFEPLEVDNYSGVLRVVSDHTSGTNTIPISGVGTTAPRLSGVVTSTSGTPLSAAKVTFVDGANQGKSATTAANGSYQITGIANGGYTVVATLNGYVDLAKPVGINGATTLNFALARRSSSTPSPSPSPPSSTLRCDGNIAPATVSCPNNQGIRPPTARCNDGTYSCSQNRSGTCSSHGGVRCWVCPGPLC